MGAVPPPYVPFRLRMARLLTAVCPQHPSRCSISWLRQTEGENVLRLEQRDGCLPADNVDPYDLVRMGQVDLSIDVGGKVFCDLDSVILLPAALVDFHAPGPVFLDPILYMA